MCARFIKWHANLSCLYSRVTEWTSRSSALWAGSSTREWRSSKHRRSAATTTWNTAVQEELSRRVLVTVVSPVRARTPATKPRAASQNLSWHPDFNLHETFARHANEIREPRHVEMRERETIRYSELIAWRERSLDPAILSSLWPVDGKSLGLCEYSKFLSNHAVNRIRVIRSNLPIIRMSVNIRIIGITR